MAPKGQMGLFDCDEPDEVIENRPTPVYRADPDKVRAELHKILGEARARARNAVGAGTLRLYRTIFPRMTNWLPEAEAAQLRCAFGAEMARLEAGYWVASAELNGCRGFKPLQIDRCPIPPIWSKRVTSKNLP